MVAALAACASGCSSGGGETAGPPIHSDSGSADVPGSEGSPCVPTTCAKLGADCGEAPDGCGGTLSCGVCTPPEQCGGNGPNRCGNNCVPKSCEAASATCGTLTDSCGQELECGTCGSLAGVCVNHQCTCQSAEQCGNSIDDDCDGQVDDGCTHDCMQDKGFGNCNTDMGYGDNCDASDNTKGCQDYWFLGWCTRRSEPSNWRDAMFRWVDDRCDGNVVEPESDSFSCKHSNGHVYSCDTPIVLVKQGIPITFAPSRSAFPMGGFEACYLVDWPSPETPWLVLDRNGDGRITSGAELFGSGTVLSTGRHASHGFEPLVELDSNHDGWLTVNDLAWSRLAAWSDRNGNRESDPDELESLDAWGVTAVSLQWHLDSECDDRGNCGRETSELRYVDESGHPRSGRMVDVHLPVR